MLGNLIFLQSKVLRNLKIREFSLIKSTAGGSLPNDFITRKLIALCRNKEPLQMWKYLLNLNEKGWKPKRNHFAALWHGLYHHQTTEPMDKFLQEINELDMEPIDSLYFIIAVYHLRLGNYKDFLEMNQFGKSMISLKWKYCHKILDLLFKGYDYLNDKKDSQRMEILESITSILNQMGDMQMFGSLGYSVVNKYLFILGVNGLTSTMYNFYMKLIKSGHVVTLKSITICCKSFARDPECPLEYCEKLIKIAKDFHVFPDAHLYSIIASGYARVGDTRKLLDIEEKMRSMGWWYDLNGYVLLLSSYYYNGYNSKCIEVAMEMKARNIAHNLSSYTTLLFTFIKTDRMADYLQMRKEMQDCDLKLPKHILLALIAEMATVSWNSIIVQEWKHFRATNELINLTDRYIYILLDAHSKTYNFSECFKLINMKKIKQPSLFYHILLNVLKSEKYHEFTKFKKLMHKNNIIGDINFYCSLVDLYGKMGDLKKLESISEEITRYEIIPDINFYNHLLAVYTMHGRKKDYDFILEKLISEFEPDEVTFSIMLNMFSKFNVGNINELELKYRNLLKNGDQSKVCPSNIVRAYSYCEQFENAKYYWETHSRQYNLYNRPMAVSIAIDAAGRKGDLVWLNTIVQNVNKGNLNQNNVNSLIEAYCRLGLYTKGLNWVRFFLTNFKSLDSFNKTYWTIYQGFLNYEDEDTQKQVEILLQELNKMPRN
jgi:hypothetical protein